MLVRSPIRAVAFLVCTQILVSQEPSHADLLVSSDTFGSGTNAFAIDFVGIGNTNNAADANGFGAVPYEYRISTYEISQTAIDKATAGGMANVTAGRWTGSQPAANISWYEAAAFVNWMNTNSGFQAAYNLNFTTSWSMSLWSASDAWTLGGTNLYRHKNAIYFLPSDNEWYKAAYYNPAGANYFLYSTANGALPSAVTSGTNANTAVWGALTNVPAAVNLAGGLNPYGTMGQAGNVLEWIETASDRNNSSPSEDRTLRGGSYQSFSIELAKTYVSTQNPGTESITGGFRVASVAEVPVVPEPGTWAAAALLVGGAGYMRWRRWRGVEEN